jgi:hypothetical protein
MQREAAAVAGLDPALAAQIQGETAQAMIEHADTLVAAQQQVAAAAELDAWRMTCRARYHMAPTLPLAGDTPAAIEMAARNWARNRLGATVLPPPMRADVPVDPTPVARYTPPPLAPAWQPPPRPAYTDAPPKLVTWGDAGTGREE